MKQNNIVRKGVKVGLMNDEKLQDCVLKVKIWFDKTFYDFVENPGGHGHGSIKEATGSINPIKEIELGMTKMSIDGNNILKLNDLSSTIFYDLERVHKAAFVHGIHVLCESIERYLMYLINHQNFGEIYQKVFQSNCINPEELGSRRLNTTRMTCKLA
jgi:hypothetical protein